MDAALGALATALIMGLAAFINTQVRSYRKAHVDKEDKAPPPRISASARERERERESKEGDGQSRLAAEEGWESYAMKLGRRLRQCQQISDLQEEEIAVWKWSIRQEHYDIAQRIIIRAALKLEEDRKAQIRQMEEEEH